VAGPSTGAGGARGGPEGTGALVVEDTVPGGPGEGRLQVGDVLVRVDGRAVTDFVALEVRPAICRPPRHHTRLNPPFFE